MLVLFSNEFYACLPPPQHFGKSTASLFASQKLCAVEPSDLSLLCRELIGRPYRALSCLSKDADVFPTAVVSRNVVA